MRIRGQICKSLREYAANMQKFAKVRGEYTANMQIRKYANTRIRKITQEFARVHKNTRADAHKFVRPRARGWFASETHGSPPFICVTTPLRHPWGMVCGEWHTGNGAQEWCTGNGVRGMAHREWGMVMMMEKGRLYGKRYRMVIGAHGACLWKRFGSVLTGVTKCR